jgi:NTP pyrophosphatase (non-canonical NTP hydrolase)
MLTEVAELMINDSETNLVEECGDVLWYAAIICDEFKIETAPHGYHVATEDVIIVVSEIADQAKRAMFYGASPNEIATSGAISMVLQWVTQQLGSIPIESCFERNIAKLKKRFPDKFDSSKALNRDIVSERKALEGNPEN